MGGHISAYMDEMKEDDEEMYKVHFKGYLDLGLDYDDLEDMYEKAFGLIREDPSPSKGYTFEESDDTEPVEPSAFSFSKTGKEIKKTAKKTYADRRADADAKKARLQAEDEDED